MNNERSDYEPIPQPIDSNVTALFCSYRLLGDLAAQCLSDSYLFGLLCGAKYHLRRQLDEVNKGTPYTTELSAACEQRMQRSNLMY